MISGLYSAATAMDASTRRHEVAAENLANINMPGYRRRVLTTTSFDSLMPQQQQPLNGVDSSKLLGTATKPVTYDFTQGHLEQTKRPLDLALSGDGFFTVDGPEGPLYTRNGSFYVDSNRQLTTVDGLAVKGLGGNIVLPANVNSDTVSISGDGRLTGNGQEFAQLALTRFDENSVLEPAGSSLFSLTGEAVPLPAAPQVLQGTLELANTSSIDELIHLVEGTRHFEAAQKALNTIAESIQRRIGLR